jgi:transcriptional antiterminator
MKPTIHKYYEALGAEKCKALNYQESKLSNEYQNIQSRGMCEYYLKQQLADGVRVSKATVKDIMKQVYDKVGLKKNAKATDLTLYGFEYKEVKVEGKIGMLITYVK